LHDVSNSEFVTNRPTQNISVNNSNYINNNVAGNSPIISQH